MSFELLLLLLLLLLYIYIYTELAPKLTATASVAQSVELGLEIQLN